MIPRQIGEPIKIFTQVLFEYGNWHFNISYSTFGFAFIFDEGKLEIVFLMFYISWHKERI